MHPAACKASIHMRGACICGATGSPNQHQRSSLPMHYGVRLAFAKLVPAAMVGADLVRAEEDWAQALADRTRSATWCNGKLFSGRT